MGVANQTSFWLKIKRWIWWHWIYPIFPSVQRVLLKLRILHHRGRQPWRLGWLTPGRTLKSFYLYMLTQNFHNHFIAWQDDGQVLSIRRPDRFKYQYHLRVFNDGELRGHYETTPEDHPLDHFVEKVFEPRTEDFLRWLGGWVVSAPGVDSGKIRFHKAPAASLELPVNG